MDKLKPTPEHYCEYCGKKMERKVFPKGKRESINIFLRRKYCDVECMRRAFVKRNGEGQMWGAGHQSARKIEYLINEREKVCEICGSTTNIDVHHKDGNYQNNEESNLMLVCRSCHNKLHKPKQTCIICGKPAKGYGYCNAHYVRFKKYGDPLIYMGHKVSPDFVERGN